jgi:hypothetical protein
MTESSLQCFSLQQYFTLLQYEKHRIGNGYFMNHVNEKVLKSRIRRGSHRQIYTRSPYYLRLGRKHYGGIRTDDGCNKAITRMRLRRGFWP